VATIYPLRLEWEKRKNMRAVLVNAPDVLPLDRSAEAHLRIEAGHTWCKTLLQV
jgi:hypothetical protein